MSTTSSVSGATIPAAGVASVPVNMQINQSQFLQLITAQLKDQNPLSPTDPTQFVSQLEGMSQVSSMQSMQSSMQASQLLSGASMIGQSILAPGSTATLAAGGSIGGAVTAPAGTTKLTVSIADATGAPVASFNVTPATSGLTSFSWKGTTSTGVAAPAGTYTVSVNARVNGSTQVVTPNVVTKVSSVVIDPSTRVLDLDTDGGTVALSSVIAIM
jgi:flagellar basal-body rod modification protein FlgD